jgi:hypothetical protein
MTPCALFVMFVKSRHAFGDGIPDADGICCLQRRDFNMRFCSLWLCLVALVIGDQDIAFAQKPALNDSISRRGEETWAVAKQIWQFAEPGYQETQSSKLLADTLEKAGFVVKRGVADIPTAFTATYGEGIRRVAGVVSAGRSRAVGS